MIGFSFGQKLFAIIGPGKFILPLVYIDNLIEAIIEAMNNEVSTGNIYNVVNADKLTKKQYIEGLLKKLYPDAHYIYMPYGIIRTTVFLQEIMFRILKRKPF